MRKTAKFCGIFVAVVFGASALTSVAPARGVKEEALREHISTLASDEFEGRKPGTKGETLTIDYIANGWAKSGLKSAATDGSWFDPVPLVERSANRTSATYSINGRKLRFADEEIIMVGTDAKYQKADLPVIFVGYGVTKNGGIAGDVSGKVVFMFQDSADFLPEDLKSSRERRNILIEAGAEAIIFIAQDERGNWASLRRRWSSSDLTLASRENRAPLHGVVSKEYIVGLATAARQDWDKLSKDAESPEFGGQDLRVFAALDVYTNVRRFDSYNVVGKIPGRRKGSGAVLYLGHWDHLGICRSEEDEDRICNGAVDNASGIAVLAEVARELGRKRYDRDIYFVATTGEESGLLGAYGFAEKPPLPLEDIVIALNVDTVALARRGSKVAITGRGETPFDSIVEKTARKLGRELVSSDFANDFIQRQDGWVLTKEGVPALMIGGAFADQELVQTFLAGDYHGPGDELTEETELGGAAEDADLHIELGKYFASTRKYKRDKTGS